MLKEVLPLGPARFQVQANFTTDFDRRIICKLYIIQIMRFLRNEVGAVVFESDAL